ncbi:unnamed protein product [Fusarium langsethiae]|nr:unnamed protein product [Fusarium langsethiae]
MRPNFYNNQTLTQSPFPQEKWLCRNRTLTYALEDLINNITISFLTTQALTHPTVSNISADVSTTEVHYHYSPRRLALSYALAAFATLLSLAAGFWAIYLNGVVHNSSFSSFLYTTRNAGLDTMVTNAGLSLGADTDDGTLDDVQLRFGLLHDMAETTLNNETAKHVAFGFRDSVTPQEKGDNCY